MAATEESVRELPTVILVSENDSPAEVMPLLERLIPELAQLGYRHFLSNSADITLEQQIDDTIKSMQQVCAIITSVKPLEAETKAYIMSMTQKDGTSLSQAFSDYLTAGITDTTDNTKGAFYRNLLETYDAILPTLPAATAVTPDFLNEVVNHNIFKISLALQNLIHLAYIRVFQVLQSQQIQFKGVADGEILAQITTQMDAGIVSGQPPTPESQSQLNALNRRQCAHMARGFQEQKGPAFAHILATELEGVRAILEKDEGARKKYLIIYLCDIPPTLLIPETGEIAQTQKLTDLFRTIRAQTISNSRIPTALINGTGKTLDVISSEVIEKATAFAQNISREVSQPSYRGLDWYKREFPSFFAGMDALIAAATPAPTPPPSRSPSPLNT